MPSALTLYGALACFLLGLCVSIGWHVGGWICGKILR